jgi:hypothetical protein
MAQASVLAAVAVVSITELGDEGLRIDLVIC